MNVLVIPSWYPNGTDKLMGIYHKEFCAALAKKDNINVNMLYIDRQRLNAPFKYLKMSKKEVILEKNYKVYLRKMLDINKISSSLGLKKYCRTLDKAFKYYLQKNPKPDILHAHVTIPAGYATCKLGKKYNIPVVVTEHTSYFERFFTGKNKENGLYVLNNSYFTTVSNFMRDEMLKYTKCEVIPNLVDTDVFKKERKPINGLRLICVAALRQGKRIDDIIAALKMIIEKDEEIDAKLTIIGDGFLEDFYKNKSHELGMDNYVTFLGRKTKEEIANILLDHNIYVIASDKETFGIPGIEALASGMPIVSTKCLGPEEYIDSKCGMLVEVGNIEELAQAITQVYENLDKYDQNYLRDVADRYSCKKVIKKTIDIYEEITQNT